MVHSRLSAAAICFAMAALAGALGGCDETTGTAAGPVASAPPGLSAHRLPPGAACTSLITKYQTVTKSDLETGNLEQKVYDEIARELDRASSACEAGHDGEARAIVASSKDRHGYHA